MVSMNLVTPQCGANRVVPVQQHTMLQCGHILKRMPLDVQLFTLFNTVAGSSPFADTLIVFFAKYLPYLLVVAFLLLLFFSPYPRREKARLFLATVISSVIARGFVTELIRFFYHRPRPFLTFHLQPLIADSSWSFPSGHATFFFAMATAIYMYNKKWGTGFFIAAILVGIARIIAGVHYPSDILGGMIIGIAIAYLCVRYVWPRLESVVDNLYK